MTIPPELEAKILRYYHVEKWRVGTISAQLGVHHSTVSRVLAQAGLPRIGAPRRASAIDAYLPFILETLEKFPMLTAIRLHGMITERGYVGSVDHFRHFIALHRPKPKREAYLRLRTLPGEQSQVDWGHFGYLEIGHACRALMGFVMVLSWSRMIYVRFFLGAHMENFLRGHVGAFNAWGGLTRVVLYDNLKSAVLERQGQAIRFNPTLLEFAGFHRYEPRPVAVARGNEKGRVERAIRTIRDAFFAGRTFTSLADLNAQAEVIATHSRSFDKGAQIENPDHVATLTEYKHHASQHRNTDRLTQAVPQSRELLTLAAERGEPLGRISTALLALLDRYGVTELQAAVQEALQRGVPHPNAVRLALERRREAREEPPPVAIPLPSHVQKRDTIIQPHDLDSYDQITGSPC